LGSDNNIYGIPNNARTVFKLTRTEPVITELENTYKYMYTIGSPILTENFSVYDNVDTFKINDDIWFCTPETNIYVDTTTDTFGKLSLPGGIGEVH
jgi:hypothetical protein